MHKDDQLYITIKHAVLKFLHEEKPDLVAERDLNHGLIVNGRRLDLKNLYRLVMTNPENLEDIVYQYLNHLFDGENNNNISEWEDAKSIIMPRIQPESIFDHLCRDMVAHVPFVNDTVIVFVLNFPNMIISVTTEQMARWGKTPEELYEAAVENLSLRTGDHLAIRYLEGSNGGCAAIITTQDGYDASRLLLPDVFDMVSRKLKATEIKVGIPARDMFVLAEGPPEFLKQIFARVQRDHERLPYPITDKPFLLVRDGVASTEPWPPA